MEVEVVFAYEPKEADELRLQLGAVLKKVVRQEPGWFKGTTVSGDTGVFPDNFVKIVSKDGSASSDTSNSNKTAPPAPDRESGRRRRCRAVFSYAPQHEDELALSEGDELNLLEEVEEGWWKGELRGQVGMFPSNFVEEILSGNSESGNKTASDDSLDTRDKNTINANISSGGEVKPKPVPSHGYGVREADLKKELSRKLSNGNTRKTSTATLSGHTATNGVRSGVLAGGGGSVVGISPGNVLATHTDIPNNTPPGSATTNGALGRLTGASNLSSAFQPPPAKHKDGKSGGGLYPSLGGKTKADRDRINSAEREATTAGPDNKAASRSSLIGGGGSSGGGRQSSLNRKTNGTTDSAPLSTGAAPPQLPPKPVREIARALYPYTAEHEDELSLREGDLITVLCKELEDRGWWRGELAGRQGVFPDNFVTLIATDDTPKPPRPDKPPCMGSRGGSTGSPAPSTPSPVSNSPTPHSRPGEGVDPQLQHVSQAPPLPDKRPSPPSPTQGSFPLQSPLTNGHDMSDGGERLQHLNQNRPKGPARRPPSAIFKGNMRHSSGDSESSSLSIESPPKSNNLTGNPMLDFPSSARQSPPQPPSTPKPTSTGTPTPLPSSSAPAASKDIDQALSNIVLRANSGRSGAATPSSMMPTTENEPPTAPSRSPMARPNTTFIPGANQSTVPWLQELNAKQQKRKSHNFEPGGKESDPPAPPPTAKPSVSSPAKPQPKLQSSPQLQADPLSAKQATKNIFAPKPFGGSQQQKPSASSFSSATAASQPQDVVDSTKAPQQPLQPATPASRAPKHTTPQSSSTGSIQPDVELRRPTGHSQPPSVTSIQPDVQIRRTPSISSQHSSTAGSYQPDVQQLRKQITEPDVISSASSSRKSSAASTSASVSASAAVAAAVAATKLDGAASQGPFAASPRTASFAGDGEPARVSNPVSAATMVRAAHESGSVSSVTVSQVSLPQAPAPSPQPSVVAPESLAAPVGTSTTTTVLSPSPLFPSTAQGTNTSSTSVPHPTPSSHPPKKHSNSDKASSVLTSDSVIPKDIIEDAKALDNANAILNKLLPKVSALENRLEEQKREHTRQLNMLMSELDDERKKRACLEIEMERLKKMVLAYTTQV